MTKSLLVATRSSELALRQARLVQSAFARAGVVTELKTYKTLGDKKLDEPLNAIGGKGLFTRELEVDRPLCRAMPSKSAGDAQDLENSQRSKDPSSRAA